MAATQSPPNADAPILQLREEAVQRLKKKQDLRAHLLVYVLVNSVLWGIWALLTPDVIPWPAFPMAIWGVGLVMNIWEVYGRRPFTEADIRAEMERLERH